MSCLGSARHGKKVQGQLACCPKSPRRCVPISCTTNPRSPAPPEHRFWLLCRLRRSPGGCWCSGSFAVLIFRAPNSAQLIQAVWGGEKARGDDNCGLGAPAFWIPALCSGLKPGDLGPCSESPEPPREFRAKSCPDQCLQRGKGREGEGEGSGHEMRAPNKAEARWGTRAALRGWHTAPHPRDITPGGC